MNRWLAAFAALFLLSACGIAPVREALPPAQQAAAEARQEEREAVLAGVDAWSLGGRVALTNHGRGGSGAIAWRQQGDRYEISLSAPITRQSWRLVGEPGGLVRLEGLEGGTRVGTDAAGLLRAATGWEIPVAALSDWVRGARHREGGPAELVFSADGRLARLQQDGWVLAFDRWQPAPGGAFELPGRIEAERGEARVRLVVDQWQSGPMP